MRGGGSAPLIPHDDCDEEQCEKDGCEESSFQRGGSQEKCSALLAGFQAGGRQGAGDEGELRAENEADFG